MIAETMLPAAPVTRNTLSALKSRAAVVHRRLLLEGDRPAQTIRVADLDRAGVGERLLEQRVGDLGDLCVTEIDRLDERVAPLAVQCLREACNSATEHARCAIGAVAVLCRRAASR